VAERGLLYVREPPGDFRRALGLGFRKNIVFRENPQKEGHLDGLINTIVPPSQKYSLRYSKAKGFLKSFTLSKYIDDFFVNVKKELHKIESIHSIDIIHKVTPNSYRKAIDLSEFNNATRVYGPCGGAQETPHFLFKSLSFSARFSEYAHRYINHKTLKSNCFRVAINSYDHVLCTNIETKEAIDPLLISHQDCTVLTDVGIDTLACFEECKPAPKVFTLLWIGRMIPRKGLSIFFDALKLVYCNYHVILVGDGPERKKLVRKVKKAGLSSKVTFIGRVDHCEVMNFYRLANLFVFPSLRESGGNVVLESISQGVPVMAERNVDSGLPKNG
jgi:glycosyltransferase involved in cell wall biosynthesis